MSIPSDDQYRENAREILKHVLNQLNLDIRAWKILQADAQANKKESKSFGHKAAALEDFRTWVAKQYVDLGGLYIPWK